MAKRGKKKKKKGNPGNGLGAHQNVSPMGRATQTKTKEGRRRAADRRKKQTGWSDA